MLEPAPLQTPTLCTRPARRGQPAGGPARCAGCGRSAKAMVAWAARQRPDPQWEAVWRIREVWAALPCAEADLQVVWLTPTGRGFTQARFCARCAPSGELLVADCTGCGDGPIVLLGPPALPGMPADPAARERGEQYLRRLGWTIDPAGRRCPGCGSR